MRNRGVMIELTALLDVIMIMMFLLLMQSRQQVGDAYRSAEENVAAAAEMAAELEAVRTETAAEIEAVQAEAEASLQTYTDENGYLKRLLNGRSIAEENSCILSVSIQGGGEARYIRVEALDGAAETVSLAWDNRAYAANALHAVLTGIIRESEAQAVFIVFQYDRNLVYQSDYALVMDAVLRQKQMPHVFTAEYDFSED